MSIEYLISEINKGLKKLSDILNKYYGNYDIKLIENDIGCISDDILKMFNLK